MSIIFCSAFTVLGVRVAPLLRRVRSSCYNRRMETWVELYPPAQRKRTRRARIVASLLFWAVALGGLLFCVLACLRAAPGAERALLRRLLLGAVPCGWACIALQRGLCAPLRRFAAHAEHLRAGERETLHGTVTVTDELMRIRRSIAVRTVLLDDGQTQRRLSIYAPYARLLGAPPREMSLAVAGSYVAAFSPAPPDGPAKRKPGRAVLRALRRFFASLHNYILWALIAVFLCAFAAMRVTDVPAAEKLTVMIDAPAVDEAALAAALDDAKPAGIRLLQVRSFSYAFMETRSLHAADVFIVPASKAAQYLPDFQPLPSGLDGTPYDAGGDTWGLRVYDAAAQRGCADAMIRYDPAEDYYLFFGKESMHTGTTDDAAVRIAQAFLALGGAPAPSEAALSVEAVAGLPADFILGMDVSSLLAEERSGVRYYDFDGAERDLFEILADAGVTHIRVRVWNDPYDAAGNGYGGGNCDVPCAAALGRRAAAAGLKLIVDFHCSDFWADPGKQAPPKAWADMPLDEKADALHAFICESLQTITDAGAEIAMVQIGNETNGFFCGERDWDAIALLMQSGSQAVRASCPGALVALHFTNPERAGAYADYAAQLAARGVDYDVFASSYYPFWHGKLENLRSVLSAVARDYGKRTLVMETSYAYTDEDTDFSGNTISADSKVAKPYPYTVQGQADALRAVIAAAAETDGCLGVVYWEGAWISVGGASWAQNSVRWEKFGSGWASRFAADYDPSDAGRWYGGCAVDNQALFDASGRALPSLRVFSLVRGGR